MKYLTTILILILTAKFSWGQELISEYKILVKKADSLYYINDYKNSALNYSAAFKTKGWRALPKDRYKAAISWALANIPDSAFYNLDHLASYAHYSNYDTIIKEKGFNSLHNDNRWKILLTRIEENILPKNCFRAGSKPYSYEMFIDYNAGQEKNDVFSIKSIDKKLEGFGTLMQNSLPKEFLGKKIRMTGFIKSEKVDNWAGLWVRVDQPNPDAPKSFDNMHDRPIKGTTDWKKCEIVLFVPLNATNIAYGGLLDGTGQIWFDKLNFEIVDLSVPVTGK